LSVHLAHHHHHVFVRLLHHIDHHCKHFTVVSALFLVLFSKVAWELLKDFVDFAYKLCGLMELHVSISTSLSYLFKQREKAFFGFVKDDDIFLWNLNFTILLKGCKLAIDEILGRSIFVCMSDHYIDLAQLEVLEKFGANFDRQSLLN